MARTAQNHPNFDIYALSIQHAKQALSAKRKAFLEGEAQRWAVESAAAQAQLTAAVQAFHAEGANVSTLCKAYGTTDRATILRMLPADGAPTPTPATPTHTATTDRPAFEVTNPNPKEFTVLETSTGHALVFDVQVAPARIVRADKASQDLKAQVKADPEHPIRALLPLDLKA